MFGQLSSPWIKDIINLDAVPSRRHENFRREGHLVTIEVRETETVSLSLTPIATRCPSRRKFSCRLLGPASRFIISLPGFTLDSSVLTLTTHEGIVRSGISHSPYAFDTHTICIFASMLSIFRLCGCF